MNDTIEPLTRSVWKAEYSLFRELRREHCGATVMACYGDTGHAWLFHKLIDVYVNRRES